MTTPRVTVPVDMKCSKCGARSGDDWEQCFGSCPMPGSPHYSAAPAPEGGAVDVESGAARTAIVNVVERYVTGWGGEFADNPYDAAPHLARELLAALATREEAPDWTARTEAAWAENNREEAPAEAGVQETLRVLLDNLVIAQSLSKELRQRATDEARSYLSALRAQPPAREDAQPVGWKHTDKCWGKTSYSDEMAHCYCQKEQEKEASLQPVGWLRPDTLKGLMDADESVVGIQSLVAAHETKHNTVAVYTHPAPDALRVAVSDIAAERQRQVDAEGWSADRDDGYADAELAKSAAAYTLSACGFSPDAAREMWPRSWSAHWWKPTTARRDLVKAGALIVAEIERLDRQALAAMQAEQKGGA